MTSSRQLWRAHDQWTAAQADRWREEQKLKADWETGEGERLRMQVEDNKRTAMKTRVESLLDRAEAGEFRLCARLCREYAGVFDVMAEEAEQGEKSKQDGNNNNAPETSANEAIG